jgi:hypothetical protein
MAIKILKTVENLIGNIGANWIFNRKLDRWEIHNPTTKARKSDLIYAARPFPIMKDDEITGWMYEMSFYPDDTSVIDKNLKLTGPMSVILLNSTEAFVLGCEAHPETGAYVPHPQILRGMKIKLNGGYYQKSWVDKDGNKQLDHCLQVKQRHDLVILPRFQRLSPFEVAKFKAKALK